MALGQCGPAVIHTHIFIRNKADLKMSETKQKGGDVDSIVIHNSGFVLLNANDFGRFSY